MKKTTLNFALGMAVAGLIMTGASASAFGQAPSVREMQNDMMMQTMGEVSRNVASQMAGQMPSSSMGGQMAPTTGMITQMAQAGMNQAQTGGYGGMMGGQQQSWPNQTQQQQWPSSSMPPMQVDLNRVVGQAIQSSSSQGQFDQGAQGMAGQNLGQLSRNSSISRIRNDVRNQIMVERVADISRLGQNTFRRVIQPQAVQSMINQIRPWEFPSRFQNSMMPNMIPSVSGRIKPRQIQYMQRGINSPGFPNVPLPYGGTYQPQGQNPYPQNPYPQNPYPYPQNQQKW